MRRVDVVMGSVCFLAVIGAFGCGSRVDTAGTAATTIAGAAATTTTTAGASAGKTTTSTASSAPTSSTSSAAPSATSSTAPAVDALANFCEATKLLDLSDVTAFEAYDAPSAAKLIFTFDKIQKAAPAELTIGFKDMRPLIEALNQQVKNGTVTDRESLKAWLLGLNETNQAALEQFVRGQAVVVPFVEQNCA